MNLRRLLVASVGLLMPLSLAWAEAASAPLRFKPDTDSAQTMGDGAAPLLWLLAALVLVLAGWWAKSGRPLPKWGPAARRSPRITVLDSQVIGPSQRLVCVQFHGRELLLGVAADRVTLLTEHKVANQPPSPDTAEAQA